MAAMASRKKAATPKRRPPASAEGVAAAKRKFEEGVLKRGEAVPAGAALPPGATHEIVGKDAAGKPVLRRKRFSLR